jgi:hypothetical protein
MNMKRFLIIAFLCAGLTGLYAQSDLQPAAIVRLTRSEPITVKQLRTEVERFEQTAGRALSSAERRQVLDMMINEKLAIQAAGRDRVTVSDSEIGQQMQQLRASQSQALGRQISEAEFATMVQTETKMDMAAFREQTGRQLLVQKYLMSKKQNIIQAVTEPQESDIQNLYNLSKAQLVRPETVRVSVIQVPFGQNAADRTKALDLANQLSRDIGSNSAKFDETVVRAQAPNAGYQAQVGAYIPLTTEAQQRLGQEFMTAAFNPALKQGEVSRVITTPAAYIIFKVTESYSMKYLALDDLYELGTAVTVREYIRQGLGQQRIQEAIARASAELVTELRAGNSFQIFENNLNW